MHVRTQARPNTSLFRLSWDRFRSLLPRPCSASRARKIYICCRNARTNAPLDVCRVPHALTDLMMSRVRSEIFLRSECADGRCQVFGDSRLVGVNGRGTRPSVYCFAGKDDLTTPRLLPPDGNSASLHRVLGIRSAALRICYGKWRLLGRPLGCEPCETKGSPVCCRRDGSDLVCRAGRHKHGEARAAGFYAPTRLAYHLFDSFQAGAFKRWQLIERSNLTVAPLYRRALGISYE